MTSILLMLLLSTIGAQRVSCLLSCPASCVVCSEDVVICHRLAHIIDAPDSTQALLLTEGSISTVHPSSLSDLRNITLIGLSHNRISELGEQTFRNLSFLHTLLLDHNLLTSQALQGGALTNLAHLEVLALGNNQINMVQARWFEGTRALRTLQLEGNLLTRLDSGSFPLNDLRVLEVLDLSDNLIEHLDRDSFRGLVGLRSLDLSRNRLSSSPTEAFSYLSWLTSLNLDLNTWNCSCQLLELSAFLSNFIQQPDKVLYNGRRMVCVSADNPAVTTVLELTDANCVPSNQNITVQIEAGHSVTPQIYARDLAVAAVVCFTGGVGLTLLVVLIYHQVSRRKKRKDKNAEKEKEEGRSTMANHSTNHLETENRKDVSLPANSSQPWDREATMLDSRIQNPGDHFRSRVGELGGHFRSRVGELGGHFRCPDCSTDVHREAGLHVNRWDNQMHRGMGERAIEEIEEERERERMKMMEEGRRPGIRQHFQQVALHRDTVVVGNKPLSDGSSRDYFPTHREEVAQSILRPDVPPTYRTGRETDSYRTDMDGPSRAGYEMLSCDRCQKTYDYRTTGQTDRQGRYQYTKARDSALPDGYRPQHRPTSRGRNVNYNRLDLERNGGSSREMRNVSFDLESRGTLERGNVLAQDGRERLTSREKDRGRTGGREEGSGRRKAKVQSSRLLKVKLNLNPLRRSKVHPKKKNEQAHTEKGSSRKEKQGKGGKEKRKEGRGRGEKAERGSSSQKNKQSNETKTKSKTKTKAPAGDDEEEEDEEGGEEKQKTSKTQRGPQEGSEGDQHGSTHAEQPQHTPNESTNPSDQSDPTFAAGGSVIGQQAGPPFDGQGQNIHAPRVPYHGNSLVLQSSQPHFPLSAPGRTHTTNLSLLGAASSQLTGSSLSLQGGNLLSNMALTTNTLLPSNTIAPNIAYGGLSTLNTNPASTGNPESFSRQGGLGLNSPATSLLANTIHTNALLTSTVNPSTSYMSQPGVLASSLAANPIMNPTSIQSLGQSQPPPDTIPLGRRLGTDPAQGPGLQSGEGLHQMAPQHPALQTRDNLSLPAQALDPTGRDDMSLLAHQPPGSVTADNLSNNNSQAQSGPPGGVSVSGGALGGPAANTTTVGVSTFDGSAGGVSVANTHSAGASAGATLLQQEYLSEEGGSSPRRKLRLVLPEKTSSRPPTALERKIR